MRSPNGRILASPYSISQTLYERIKRRGKPERSQLSKHFIGAPINFKHLCHVEWSPQTGLATNLSPELKMIFAKAGITQDHLKDKRTSKKIFKTIEKQGGVAAVLEEAKTKGVGFLHHPQNELGCQAPNSMDGLNNIPAEHFPTSASCSAEIPSVVMSPAPSTSSLQRSSQPSFIQNLKEVQLKRAKSDHPPTPLKQEIREGTQASHQPTSPSDRGIVAALKDVIQKRHKALHASDDEDSDLENGGDEWDD